MIAFGFFFPQSDISFTIPDIYMTVVYISPPNHLFCHFIGNIVIRDFFQAYFRDVCGPAIVATIACSTLASSHYGSSFETICLQRSLTSPVACRHIYFCISTSYGSFALSACIGLPYYLEAIQGLYSSTAVV